jgi:hypothetical protein
MLHWEEALQADHDASSKTTTASGETLHFDGRIEKTEKGSTAGVGKSPGRSSS